MKLEYLWQFIFILVGAFASGYAGYYYANQPETNTVLEYQEYTNKNLKNIFGGTESVKILYQQKELEALSSVRYSLMNNTGKNIDKFKIYFEVEDKKNIPLFHSLTPPDSYPKEAVTLISKDNGVYIFEVEYFNKTNKTWNGLDFVFYFSGSEPSIINIKTGSKGIYLKKYEYQQLSVIHYILKAMLKMWWVLAVYILIAYVSFKVGKVRRYLHKKDIHKTLVENISENTTLSTEEKITKIKDAISTSPKIKLVFKNWNIDREA